MAAANDLRKGQAIRYNGDIYIVLEVTHRTPGNLRAFVQAIIRSIKTGKSSDVRFSSTEKVELVDVSRETLEFSYKDKDEYHFIDPSTYEDTVLRENLIGFLKAVTPVAERLGVKLTLHPDDPPRSLFGLPRIASSREDYAALFEGVPSQANGMCFCTGSLGVAASNDLPAIANAFASRIFFAHLRATRREPDGSFYEADHLGGDVDMVAVIRVLLDENRRRPADRQIAFRPDHGHLMLDDLHKHTNPGYSAIGRLKGLAELRGVIHALSS